MKAVSPVRHPNRKALASGCCCGGGGGGGGGGSDGGGGGGGGDLPLGFLSDPGCLKGSEVDEPAALCLQCDMNDCYSRLRKLVPTIPPHKRVSKVEILQHVIDYILDLQLALETHPALLRQQQQQPLPQQQPPQQQQQQLLAPHQAPRTPLTALNVDPAAAVNKQGDSILCR